MKEQKFDGYPMINESPLFIHYDLNIREKMTQPTPLQQTLCSMLPYGLKIKTVFDEVVEITGYVDHYRIVSIIDLNSNSLTQDEFTPILRRLSDLTDDQLSIIGRMLREYDVDRQFNIEDAQAWIKGSMKPLMNLKQNIEIIQYLHSIFANIYDVPEGQFIPVTKTFNPYK